MFLHIPVALLIQMRGLHATGVLPRCLLSSHCKNTEIVVVHEERKEHQRQQQVRLIQQHQSQ